MPQKEGKSRERKLYLNIRQRGFWEVQDEAENDSGSSFSGPAFGV